MPSSIDLYFCPWITNEKLLITTDRVHYMYMSWLWIYVHASRYVLVVSTMFLANAVASDPTIAVLL